MNRSFIMLLVLVIFLGAGFGGSFVGGVIYGQNQAENAGDELSPRLGTSGQFPGGGQGANAAQRGQGRQGSSGGATSAQSQRGGFAGGQGEGSTTARQGGGPGNVAAGQERGTEGTPEAQDSAGGDAENPSPAAVSSERGRAAEGTAQANANRGGAAGTVQGLEGDVLTITTSRGELTAMLSESTRVFQVSETDRESIEAETGVRVVGSRNPEGGIAAQSVIIVPEGAENLFGGGGPGGRQRGQAR